MIDHLQKGIKCREAKIAVIGLGYVGLPVACSLASAGFPVTGLDIQEDRVRRINAGDSPIGGNEPGLAELLAKVVLAGHFQATTEYNQIRDADIVLINVETPVGDDHVPRYRALKAAAASAGQVLKDGALVIIESTVAPGTMNSVVQPILEESSGKRLDDGFFLGHCPERVMPGKLLSNLAQMSRVCGGSSAEVAELMVLFYRTIVSADLDPTDCVTAEIVKTAENAYRDVNIAFANELALVCESNGAQFTAVRELINKSPGRNVLMAGAGVGGHCIPKDPWLLVNSSIDKVPIQLVPAARSVNEFMPQHMVHLLEKGLAQHGKVLSGAKIAVMGYAYLENSDDTRNSPTIPLVIQLQDRGAAVAIHDPYVGEYAAAWEDVVEEADAAVFMVAHDAYRALDLRQIKYSLKTPILIDGRSIFSREQLIAQGFTSYSVGTGDNSSNDYGPSAKGW